MKRSSRKSLTIDEETVEHQEPAAHILHTVFFLAEYVPGGQMIGVLFVTGQ